MNNMSRVLRKIIAASCLLACFLVVVIGVIGLNFPTASAFLGLSESSQSASIVQPSAVPSTTPIIQTNSDDPLVPRKLSQSKRINKKNGFIEDELIVIFKEGVSESEQRRILKENNLFVNKVASHRKMKDKVLRVDPAKLEEVLAKLKGDPNIQFIGKNAIYRGRAVEGCVPNDPYYCNDLQWGLESVRARMGWTYAKGSSSVVVAVIDSGINYNNLDLGLYAPFGTSDGRIIKGKNFTEPDLWHNDPIDTYGHGTAVAGVIGAKANNAWNIAGVDWYSKIVAIKAGWRDPETNEWRTDEIGVKQAIYEAIEPSSFYYIDYNQNYSPPPAKIINISSAGKTDSNNYIRQAVEYAQQAGAIIVASVDFDDVNPARSDCFVGFPAAYPGVIGVVAIDNNSIRRIGCTSPYSPYDGQFYQGPMLAAPGVDIASLDVNNDLGVPNFSGTSLAAPFVSGVASILASCSSDIKNDLTQGAIDLGAPGYDWDTGYGKVSLYNSLMNSCYEPMGDVDCSGSINASDATHILRNVAGLEGLSNNCEPGAVYRPEANVDRDGDIDAVDALYVLQYSAGIRATQTQSLISPNTDTDGDGMTNQQEAQYSCLNPNVADATVNPDNDSVSAGNINVNMTNVAELAIGTNPCVVDTDGDEFKDGVEMYIGTDPNLKCGINAWPPDFNNSGSVTNSDVLSFSPSFNSNVGDTRYDRRHDLSANGVVSLQDILKLSPSFNKSCTP